MVNKVHIDLLVYLAAIGPKEVAGGRGHWSPFRWRHDGHDWTVDHEPANRTLVGRLLWTENARSVRARYEDADESGMVDQEEIDLYVWEPPANGLAGMPGCHGYHATAVEGLKAVDCFEYQSCEHGGWRESSAFAYCDVMRRHLVAYVP